MRIARENQLVQIGPPAIHFRTENNPDRYFSRRKQQPEFCVDDDVGNSPAVVFVHQSIRLRHCGDNEGYGDSIQTTLFCGLDEIFFVNGGGGDLLVILLVE